MGVAQGKPLSYVPGGDLEGKIMPSFTLTENTDNHLITHVPVDWRVEPTGDAVHQIRLTAFLHAKGMPARYPGCGARPPGGSTRGASARIRLRREPAFEQAGVPRVIKFDVKYTPSMFAKATPLKFASMMQ